MNVWDYGLVQDKMISHGINEVGVVDVMLQIAHELKHTLRGADVRNCIINPQRDNTACICNNRVVQITVKWILVVDIARQCCLDPVCMSKSLIGRPGMLAKKRLSAENKSSPVTRYKTLSQRAGNPIRSGSGRALTAVGVIMPIHNDCSLRSAIEFGELKLNCGMTRGIVKSKRRVGWKVSSREVDCKKKQTIGQYWTRKMLPTNEKSRDYKEL